MIPEVILTALVSQVAKKGIETVFDSTIDKITKDSIDWFKSLFYKKDGKPKKIMEELNQDPLNETKLNEANAIILNAIEDNPQLEGYLKEILKKSSPIIENKIIRSKNVVTGNVNTEGGDFRVGDDYGTK